jgi:hypothetical protein
MLMKLLKNVDEKMLATATSREGAPLSSSSLTIWERVDVVGEV